MEAASAVHRCPPPQLPRPQLSATVEGEPPLPSAAVVVKNYRTVMDGVTSEKVNRIIQSEVVIPSAAGENHGDVISRVSSAFLGTPYQAGTLTGGGPPDHTPEALVADFNGVDCFTLADYVEALSRSRDQRTSFLHNLAGIRYVNGRVDWLSRRHFFSDWFATAPPNARDVTPDVSPDRYVVAEKQLNRRSDGGGGGEYVPGLGVTPRRINYVPGTAIDEQVVMNNLRTGDYVGVYSPLQGLDVSHVGIVVRDDDGKVWFRNASSLAANGRRVVDSPFMEYMRSKPGIVVLRSTGVLNQRLQPSL